MFSSFSHLAIAKEIADVQQDINSQLNTKLSEFQSAFEQLDTKSLTSIYANDAVFISESRNDEIVQGKSKILKLYQSFFDKITRKKATLEVDFRVIERRLRPQSAIDVGYYIVRFHPAKESGEPVSEFAGKFINNYELDESGNWYLAVDANTRSQADLYYNAKPAANLYFGRQFIEQQSYKQDETPTPRQDQYKDEDQAANANEQH
ncbi:nuclear transport factor 2 family protein [Shewanella sp. WXL01]|uniref:Nuclear transport factor 2 family protein n=2 Tax=Shewanellaceae TaxID=267890 RepID=A0A411PNB7_9GAMM|nr:nuclear transport factor 2 family protein [Shewanella sp. WXL01]QBF84991.1 nuclear transport factor 2 family protein [Shewanella maritima]